MITSYIDENDCRFDFGTVREILTSQGIEDDCTIDISDRNHMNFAGLKWKDLKDMALWDEWHVKSTDVCSFVEYYFDDSVPSTEFYQVKQKPAVFYIKNLYEGELV